MKNLNIILSNYENIIKIITTKRLININHLTIQIIEIFILIYLINSINLCSSFEKGRLFYI